MRKLKHLLEYGVAVLYKWVLAFFREIDELQKILLIAKIPRLFDSERRGESITSEIW